MMQLHKELFDANYWKMLQSNIKEDVRGCLSLPAQEAVSLPARG
jgi:isocitrate dehydrogenase kinase/phosphatase